MAPSTNDNILLGSVLQCIEAGTLGLPFEIVKTFMGKNRGNTTISSTRYIYGNKGIRGFWEGFPYKMIESALKGPVLLASKEATKDACLGMNLSPAVSGTIAGGVGGVAQTIVIAPMTFLVTRKVSTQNRGAHEITPIQTIRTHGISGMYSSAPPIALRQASNWALRQGFVDFFRTKVIQYKYPNLEKGKKVKLSKWEDVMCGILGGTCACINQPFEVARIEMQWRAAEKQHVGTTNEVLKFIYKERGIRGLYAALTPRICLSVWQTLFMVTFADFIIEALHPPKNGHH
eukprot:PhF_6_TR26963/c0_g1_i2/m.39329